MNSERLAEYLGNTLMSGEKIQITEVIQHNSGWENDVYSFTVARQDGLSSDYILRVYQGSTAAVKAKRECKGIQTLREAGFPVPCIYATEYGQSILGKPFVIMEKIQGRTLAQALRDASPVERTFLLTSFCRLLADLHNLDWRPFVDDSMIYRDNPYACADKVIRQLSELIQQFEMTEMEPVLRWTHDYRNEVPCHRPSVIHWDFHQENVLVREDGKLFVIDWTQLEVSDFRFDLAWTLLVGTTNRAALYPIILQEYERYAGAKAEHLVFFEAIALTKRLLSMLIPLRFGAESLGMRPDARAMIASDLNHLHFVSARLSEVTGLQLPALTGTINACEQT